MVIVIAGPTASGKSALAIEVAKKLNGEIISADSMQIYRGMNIGTAKISTDEMQCIPHHMLDIVSPKEEFSVAEYSNIAEMIIKDIESRDKIAIICGGTGFYIQSLLYSFEYGGTEKNEELRNRLNEEAVLYGKQFVFDKLKSLSPETANLIHVNNLKRVIRAIEIAKFGQNEAKEHADRVPKRKFLYFVTQSERDVLYEKINRRVHKMIESGLQEEVERLLSEGVLFTMQSMQGIGYKEWRPFFSDSICLKEIIETIQKNSRHYAKRQETWFKRENPIIPLNTGNKIEKLTDYICNCYENHFKQ